MTDDRYDRYFGKRFSKNKKSINGFFDPLICHVVISRDIQKFVLDL